MIIVDITDSKLTLAGHADYAPKGYDIVCEAVGALTQTFSSSLPEWRTVRMEPGYVEFDLSDKTHDEDILYACYMRGIELLASGYPKNIAIKH